MADPKGFLKHGREVAARRPVDERVQDWNEVYPEGAGRRCCRSSPSRRAVAWTAASRSATRAARSATSSPSGTTWSGATTGRVPPSVCTRPTTSPSSPAACARAPCETACVLGINQDPVTIKNVEVDDRRQGLGRGLRTPAAARVADRQAPSPSSAPAPPGLAVAQQLTRAGHTVAVYERADKIGGCCATASPSSRWRRSTSTAGSTRCAARAPSSVPASTSGEC